MDKENFTIGEKDEILNFFKMKNVLVFQKGENNEL